jgi:hypothetical protein
MTAVVYQLSGLVLFATAGSAGDNEVFVVGVGRILHIFDSVELTNFCYPVNF